MSLIIMLIGLASLGLSLYLVIKLTDLQNQLAKKLDDNADNLSEQVSYQLDLAKKDQVLALNQELSRQKTETYQQLADIRDVLHKNLSDNRDRSDQRLELINQSLTKAVKEMQESNEKRLDQMRATVEEKLEQTLQSRLQASFATVSKQLESVNQGLGQMKTVAQDVGTLNKVLSNTKTRGIMGELQLGQIIEDIMTDSQYEREFATVKGSSDRVEYAIKLPGNHNGDYVYLPIDSKFPLEDYYRLEEAYESSDSQQIETYRKSLLA
ncbi:DNA recombination protein RmuC, partial [Streptococcus sobrinus]